MADARSYTAGRFALFTDGQALGYVKSCTGGNIKGEVATHNTGPDNIVRKHLATISHEEITVEVGAGMGKGFYDWIRASFQKAHITKNGEVIAADFDYKAQRRTEFFGAYISSVSFPACDGSSKEPAYLTVKINPETLRYVPAGGEQLSATFGTTTKKWVCANFRFELGDLPCKRVSKIDSFEIKQGVIMDQVGEFREPTKHPSKVEIPNLKVTFSAADAKAWEDWFRSFVIDGNCTDSDELNGVIEFLAPNHKDVLGRVELSHVGIISLQPAKFEANKEEVARMEAELYVEEMDIIFNESDG